MGKVMKINSIVNPAAIVIDMQYSFLSRINNLKRIVDAQCETIKYFSENSLPVILMSYKDGGQVIPIINKAVNYHKKPIKIIKRHDDCFSKTNLEYILKEKAISNIVLMGVNASACVKDTAITGLEKGFRIATASDLISDNRVVERGYGLFYESQCNWFKNYSALLERIKIPIYS